MPEHARILPAWIPVNLNSAGNIDAEGPYLPDRLRDVAGIQAAGKPDEPVRQRPDEQRRPIKVDVYSGAAESAGDRRINEDGVRLIGSDASASRPAVRGNAFQMAPDAAASVQKAGDSWPWNWMTSKRVVREQSPR